MYYLIRKQSARDGAIDNEFEGDELTLGGEDASVQLAGFSGTLTLRGKGEGQAHVATQRGDSLAVNGKDCRKANITVGDTISVPGYRLEVIRPPSGFDFALGISADASTAKPYGGELDLADSSWSIRRWSWLLAIVVLIPFLLIPLAGLIEPELAPVLRNSALPDDGLWSTGPLIAAHRISGIETDCQACHEQAFVMVRDQACLSCHRDITEHVDIVAHENHDLTAIRCASCHREHNEPERIVRRDNGLCTDCHAQPDALQPGGEEQLQAVEAFTEERHPPFRLALLKPRGTGGSLGWEVQRTRPDSSPLLETSNLKFDHSIHLDIDKVRDESSGAALVCADCHRLQDDGEHFQAITMDNDCRQCHGLSFDIFEPDLQLPHGDLRAAVVAMEAHFIREFTDPALRRERAAQKPRRVPGKRQSAVTCSGTGLDCGRAEAMKEAQYQFENTGCITCHVVVDTAAKDIKDRWFVQPIRITSDWYPHGRFDHAAHLALAWEEDTEVCAACHPATKSELAEDILIPDRDNCLQCHDENKGDSAVDCVTCHAFHQKSGSLSSTVRKAQPFNPDTGKTL